LNSSTASPTVSSSLVSSDTGTTEYQAALAKLDELEDELMLCDFTDPRRYEIDTQITQLEAWIEDLLSKEAQ
jgi:hypothetical protein